MARNRVITSNKYINRALTYEIVPLKIEVSLVGQTASHDVRAVVVTGLHRHQALAVGTVDHLQQRFRALGCGVHLMCDKTKKKKESHSWVKGDTADIGGSSVNFRKS